jgi:hypothetical protein
MGIVNMLLGLPAGKQMLALPPEQNAPLEAAMRQLREQANTKVAAAQASGEESLVEYWRLVSTYAKYVARAFKRENLKKEKSQLSRGLISAIGDAPQATAKGFDRYAGAHAFRLPSTVERRCMLEAVDLKFAPWVEAGDYIQVDFTAQRLTSDSLYLVAVDGKYLAIRGFHKGSAGWYLHESCDGAPRLVRMLEDRMPEGFEIVGRILETFKKHALIGGA